MKVSELGEFGLIDCLAELVGRSGGGEQDEDLVLGIGDDAAAWKCRGAVHLATTDSLIEGIHFVLDGVSWEDLGWKALASNLSDIAAMGGRPGYVLVSLGLSGDTDVEDVVALYRGMAALAGECGAAIVGGDTVGAPQLVVNITVVGESSNEEGRILTRSAARPRDVVAVTGVLGGAAAGAELLARSQDLPADLHSALLRPRPRIDEGRVLVEQGVLAAVDISDGLVSDLNHICRASGVSARVRADHVPVLPAVGDAFGERALEMAVAGGEDYELLFTAPPEVVERVRAAVSCPVTVIGGILGGGPGRTELVDRGGQPFVLSGTGWDHFTGTQR
jgi:thiamine-monophosphate kinase